MKKIKSIAVIIALALTSTTYAFAEILGETELKELYSDSTFIGESFKNGGATAYFSADGTFKCNYDSGKKSSGTWAIKGDTRCVTKSSGKKICHHTERNADGTYSIIKAGTNKKVCVVNTVKKGNHL